jgi:hypothetical protein
MPFTIYIPNFIKRIEMINIAKLAKAKNILLTKSKTNTKMRIMNPIFDTSTPSVHGLMVYPKNDTVVKLSTIHPMKLLKGLGLLVPPTVYCS